MEHFHFHSCLFGSRLPKVLDDFGGRELTLQRAQYPPFELAQFDHVDVGHLCRHIRLAANFHAAAADMADAKGEQSPGRHEAEVFRAGLPGQILAMLRHGETLWHFHSRPQFVTGTGRSGVCGSNHDVAGERVFLKHVIEGGVQFIRRSLPGYQSAGCEVGGHQSLTHAPYGARFEHGADPFEHDCQLDAAKPRDLPKWIALEALQLVLRNGQDSSIDWIADFDWYTRHIHSSKA